MLFSSIPFLYYFAPIVFALYFIVPNKFKNFILLIASLLFYAWGEPRYVITMIVVSIIGYVFGLLINYFRPNNIDIDKSSSSSKNSLENSSKNMSQACDNKKRKFKFNWSKIFMILSILITFGILAVFKYADFIISNINILFKSNISLLKLALPIGISFYTFQIASYTIDLYRGNIKVQKSLIKFMTYVSMFPQLIAGPIVRYSDIEKEIDERKIKIDDISYGIRRFIIGFSKKILLANVLGEFCDIAKGSSSISVAFMWAYIIAYSLHIYFDFSGYSDMAIGLGRVLGFHFPENFNYPYISKSITEFWRRWHITLSGWFRDYVYIPLGGNRVSKIKWLRNILIVWAFTGLWHGASWNFVIWGLYFAVILTFEKVFLKKYIDKAPSILQRIYTLLLIFISWIIFDATTLTEISYRLSALCGLANIPFINTESIYYIKSYFVVFVVGIISATPILKNIIEKLKKNNIVANKIINVFEILLILSLTVIGTGYLIDGSFNPFLYFRF